jgi:hypothetical protein
MPEYDAIVIPGGGAREGGVLQSWVLRRLERAVELHAGEYVVFLGAGTTHRPLPVDSAGFAMFESTIAAKYLLDAGIPGRLILTENCSYDTIGNAYFCKVMHADPGRLARMLVITSDFHLARTEAIFNWVFSLKPRLLEYQLQFQGVPDPAMDKEVRRHRIEREHSSLAAVPALTERIRTLQDFHRWFFTEHEAYNASRRAFAHKVVDDVVRESY